MDTFVMMIFLFQMDFAGRPYVTPMGEDPVRHYDSKMLCEQAGVIKREQMFRTAGELPELMIADIRIVCVPSQELDKQA